MGSSEVMKGKAYYGKITKQLLHQIPPKAIIILEHEDIDIVAAEEIVRKQVMAVINNKQSITGRLPRTGLLCLQEHGVPVYDCINQQSVFPKAMDVQITGNILYKYEHGKWHYVCDLQEYLYERIEKKLLEGSRYFNTLFQQFVSNSLAFASKELTQFLTAVKQLPKLADLSGNHVFIVARGPELEEDIRAVQPFIQARNTKVVAVDGAAAVLLKNGMTPNYIVGDMDSISSDICSVNTTFIAHSYMNGRSPGQKRLAELSIDAVKIPFPGLSEDLAIMLGWISGAEHIVTLGCRSSVVELVEKGRRGMGSTLLTRMYAGEIISDWKAVNRWFTTETSALAVKNRLREIYQLVKEPIEDEGRCDYPGIQ
ncbi:Uncharacterized membrane-anchored protein [Evansella caseinilytica]|uniref:Uncharacterized membrane-anchored protein n=1 Tax=Evansella caseinilytica TaxID=1503961 RepID=A0A1H3KY87_9BACI|nr:putative cytokinetic ring protein SteA [Evansella caseinilytica]SDY57040.1 Uncharacterized membrane-anchored protein [Evansella caseinilytica]